MPLVRKPDPMPSPLDYIPPRSEAYKVSNADSWWTLSELPGPKAAGLTAFDLCYFNFKTRRPTEVNWYLKHKVGCGRATRDGKNFVFSRGDAPGVIYLPKVGFQPPANEFPKTEAMISDVWMGLGLKMGSMVVVTGIDTLGGILFSLDLTLRYAGITGEVNRLGLGAGVGAGAVIVIVTGVSDPREINGLQCLEGDFNIALGGKWGHALKTGKVKRLKPFMDMLLKIGAKTPDGLRKALRANPDKWAELAKNSRSLKEALGVSPGDPPKLFVLDVPFAGGGTEASLFYGLTTLTLIDSGRL